MKLFNMVKKYPFEILAICVIVIGTVSSMFITVYEMRLSYIQAKHDADLADTKNKSEKAKEEYEDGLKALQKERAERNSAQSDCSSKIDELRKHYELQIGILRSDLSRMEKYHSRNQKETYVVRPGDTLSVIARKVYGDTEKWTEIYRANKHLIRDADSIKVNWKLYVPAAQTLLSKSGPDTSAVKLVTGNNYPPYAGQDLPNLGMITEIVARIFQKMGHKPEIEFWSWKFGYDAAGECMFAATFPYMKSPEREKKFLFSQPIYDGLVSCFVKEGFPGKFEKPEDLAGLTFCEAEGYYTPGIDALVKNNLVKVKKVKEVDTCFKMLKQGLADIVAVDQLVGRKQLKTLYGSTKGFREFDKALAIEPLHLMIPKCHPNANVLVYKFNEALADLKRKGVVKNIVRRHLQNYY